MFFETFDQKAQIVCFHPNETTGEGGIRRNMKRLITLVALSAISISVLFSANSVSAKPDTTNKKAKQQTTIVTVKAGETLTSIAEKYHTTYVQLFNANKDIANPDQIDVGDKVRIPTKNEKLPNRFASYSAATTAAAQTVYPPSSQYGNYGGYSSPSQSIAYAASGNGGNTYYAGNCTWYVKDRRPDLPNMLGNGGQWAGNAAARGYKTGATPRVGAVAEQAGHVAYVESVNSNGTVTVSEMNYVGFGRVSQRTVSASTFYYIY